MAFATFPLWLNALIFALAGVAVWRAGARLSSAVSSLADRTKIGSAFLGLLLLGGVTSLPEIATVATASHAGDASLAINNLLGSASTNILLLAIADAVLGRDALTSVVAEPATLLQGTLGMILLAGIAAAIVVGDAPAFGAGIWSGALFLLCLLSLWLSSRYERRRVWTVVDDEGSQAGADETDGSSERDRGRSVAGLLFKTALCAAVILPGGFLLARTGDAIADQSGLGSGFVGLALVGFATSLPELSATTAAVRLKRYEMAVGNIFGTNLFNISLIYLADLIYAGGPVLNQTGDFEAVAALLGLVLTGIFVLGLLERRDRIVLRMGYDSLAAIVLFIGGLVLLYALSVRPS